MRKVIETTLMLTVMLGIAGSLALAGSDTVGQGYAVWPAACIYVTPDTRAEAPMINGVPDWKHVHVTGLNLDPKCYSLTKH
jgi:hypothetical protein